LYWDVRGLFDVNMPLLYGEEEKAFRRLQEEIIKHTPDLSILAWKSPLLHQIHEPADQIYCGMLAEGPSHFAWCIKTQLLTRHPTREFSVSNNRVLIDSTILVAHRIHMPSGSDYILPVGWDNSSREKDMSCPTLSVVLRRVGNGQFLRRNPYELTSDAHITICTGTHQLLIESPVVQGSRPIPVMPSSWITEEDLSRLRPKSIRIRLGPGLYLNEASPWSRFDIKDRIFFVSDEHDDQNDWAILSFSVRPNLSHVEPIPPDHCVLYMTSWGRPSSPQCSIIPYLPYANQVSEIQSRLLRMDYGTNQVLHQLLAFNIPCTSSTLLDIPGTGFTAVVSLELRTREDIPPWMPRNHAWDVNITCSVHDSERVPYVEDKSQWTWERTPLPDPR
jgi:hypothetical protein